MQAAQMPKEIPFEDVLQQAHLWHRMKTWSETWLPESGILCHQCLWSNQNALFHEWEADFREVMGLVPGTWTTGKKQKERESKWALRIQGCGLRDQEDQRGGGNKEDDD